MDALIVSNVLLWIVVVVLAGVVLALVRQIGLLLERVAPVGALATAGGPRPGERAPEIAAVDWSGRPRTIGGESSSGHSTLLFFLSPTCPVCKTLLQALASLARHERGWLELVLASDGERSEHAAFVAEHELERWGYLLSTELGMRYGVARLPHAVLIDERGVVRASGLVNSREHLESLIVAKQQGVATLQAYLAGERGGRRVA